MDVVFNLIPLSCFFFRAYKLIFHSFYFDVAKRELFQDTQGMQSSIIQPQSSQL